MNLILASIASVSTVLSMIGLYVAFAVFLLVTLGFVIPGYSLQAALGDTQAVLLVYLLWDRLFGPYSKLLRKVASHLPAKRKTVNER